MKEGKMKKRRDNEEAVALAPYEPVDSEFRQRAYMEWRTEENGIILYGLRWKYVRLTVVD